MKRVKSFSFLLAVLIILVLTIQVWAQIQAQNLSPDIKVASVARHYKDNLRPPAVASLPEIKPKVSPYNEKDTDAVIATIKKYIGVVSSRIILGQLKKRLPEAKANNLNIDRIMEFLLEAFKDDEDALFKLTKFKERNLD
jgi:hypothetical protein